VPERLPPDESLRAGYEVRDISVSAVVLTGVVLAALGGLLHAVLWGMYQSYLPPDAPAPPVRMAGEPPVNERVAALPPPRLDGLEELRAQPPQYRSSAPVPGANPVALHPEDSRADRQERLQTYGWVDKKKGIAHIPIQQAMEAVLQMNQARAERGKKP
jgi:hypothetical protein